MQISERGLVTELPDLLAEAEEEEDDDESSQR